MSASNKIFANWPIYDRWCIEAMGAIHFSGARASEQENLAKTSHLASYKILTVLARLLNLRRRMLLLLVAGTVSGSTGTERATEGGSMAIMIFTALNGMGVSFMVYVLIHFWKEGRNSKVAASGRRAIQFSNGRSADVLVVTHPITQSAQGGLSVISMKARADKPESTQAYPAAAERVVKMPIKRFSTR
jgi:hypothetical protein